MGEVWAATNDRNGGQEVAIKVLLQRAAMKPDLVKRFEREARITSAINSPFVCKLLGVHQAQDGSLLLIFEHLIGESLADRLKREQYLPLSEVGPLIDDVLQGLAAAHAASVIHRDLKPGNIFVERTNDRDRPDRAKILDFGISKLTAKEKEEPTLTAFDATLGSFAYMAPEQIRGAARADERADIYAVGAVAFRSLTGRLPFEGTTAAVLVSLKLDRSAPSLEEVTGEKWPSGIERFLEKALHRNREGRFSTALEALHAWRAIQPGNITRASLPPSHPASKQAPKGKAASLTFSTGQFPENAPAEGRFSEAPFSEVPFSEDMATEVDDPPTMTGDQRWPGTATEKRPMEFAGPRTGSRTAPMVPRPGAPRPEARGTEGRSTASSIGGTPVETPTRAGQTGGAARGQPTSARADSSIPPGTPRMSGSTTPPPRPSSPASRDSRSKRPRTGGR